MSLSRAFAIRSGLFIAFGPFAVAVGAALKSIIANGGGAVIAMGTLVFAIIFCLFLSLIILAALIQLNVRLLLKATISILMTTTSLKYFMIIGTYIHFVLFYPLYRAEINANPQKSRISFDWGDAANWALDGTQYQTLVYDRGDIEVRKLGHIVDDDEGPGLKVATKHVVGRFFLETTF